MTMGFIGEDGIDPGCCSITRSTSVFYSDSAKPVRQASIPVIESKIRRPTVEGLPVQKRLIATVKRSLANHPATMLVGRAGSGKTFLAANIAAGARGTAWYSLDAADADWTVFQRYFRAVALSKDKRPKKRDVKESAMMRMPFELVAEISAVFDTSRKNWPKLIVLDGVHHLYDSDWFKEFIDHLTKSLPPPSHLLMTSRSKPPNSLWRLRSKQVLNVIDEKVLEISLSESEDLFSRNGLSRREGKVAHDESFGRAGKLMRILESKRSSAAD